MAYSSASFAENSVVDFLVPEASDLDIIEALGSSESSRNVEDTVLITTIPQRRLLYFGMMSYNLGLNVSLILRIK
jgi:hypothetical protein